ncbi:hypothetical protein BP6252_02875 [Coleophoma cylindrospora]|uniref:Uncharacterized protein n=1 Tax=Coleophoma cylindrospora TaxID=1849047 RepID=A0A3D8SG23_9HELO|nr:hypothetical protein BP6252_02875 [Coleophoma cylindrospora]
MLHSATNISTNKALIGSPSITSVPKSCGQNRFRREPNISSCATAINRLFVKAKPAQDPSTAVSIWEDVLRDHLARLKPSDRRLCLEVQCYTTITPASLEDTFDQLRKKYDKGLFQRLLCRIGPVTTQILSFAKALDVIAGHGPMAAGLIWGAMRILLEVSSQSAALRARILDMIEALAKYLPFFEAWMSLFPEADYKQLNDCIKTTCEEFVSFLIGAIIYFQRSSFVNTLRMLFSPGLESQFSSCEGKIQRQIKYLELNVHTAGLQSCKTRDNDMLKLLHTAIISPSTAATISLPFRFLQNCNRNDQFFGRQDDVDQLDYHFFPKSPPPYEIMESVLVHGLGGCGKSSVAKEYMYRRFSKYSVVLWLYADNLSKLETQCIRLARVLGLTVAEGHAREAVLQWINHLTVPFMIVFDNADDPTILNSYWPNSVQGSIVITSRNPRSQEEGFARHGLHLKAFEVQQGAEFLISLLDGCDVSSEDDIIAAHAISYQFDGLPLALRQAASFMRKKKCSPTQFAQIYQSRFNEIDSFAIPGYRKTVVDVWNMSISTLSQDSRLLLDTVALLDPDFIPMELFHATDVSHESGKFIEDPFRTLSAIEGLTNQSLVDHNASSKSLNVHRFFQEATFRRLKQDADRFDAAARLAIELVSKFILEDDLEAVRQPTRWRNIERSLIHVQSLYARCLDHVSEVGLKLLLRCLADLLNYGFETGQYALGEEAFRKAQLLIPKIATPDYNLLAKLYFYQCRLCEEECRPADALDAIQKSQEYIKEAAKESPGLLDTILYIRILSNQGIAFLAMGQYTDSEVHHLQAIERCSQLGMEKQCSMGNLLNNLGSCYLWSGDLVKADETLQKALLQPNRNPEGAKYTLANVRLKQKRYTEAMDLHKQAQELNLEVLGPEHHVVADGWHKLGSIFSLPEYEGFNLNQAQ